MSRTLSMILAAGCIVLAPAFVADAGPNTSRNCGPAVKTTTTTAPTNLDFSHLPPDAQRMLRDFFATRQVRATTVRRTRTISFGPHHNTPTAHTAQTSATRTPATLTRRQAAVDTSNLPPEARKMLSDFFSNRNATSNVRQTANRNVTTVLATPGQATFRSRGDVRNFTPGRNFSPLPGAANRSFTRGNTCTTANKTCTKVKPACDGSLAWADDPFLRNVVIRAIGTHVRQQQRQLRSQGNREVGFFGPAS